MLTQTSIEMFMRHLRMQGCSEQTMRAYRADLNGVLPRFNQPPDHVYDWSEVEDVLATYLNENRAKWAPKTTMRKLTTFKSWGKFMGATLLGRYRAPKPAPQQPHPIPEGMDGVRAMMDSAWGANHEALICLNGMMGLRAEECVSIRPEHFDLDSMILRFRGKGDKMREVPITTEAWKHLAKAYRQAVKNGTTLVRVKNRGARKAITRHGRRAGLSRPVASHDLRATTLTTAYAHSKDLRAVQQIAGHASPDTTVIYTKIDTEAMRQALEFAG